MIMVWLFLMVYFGMKDDGLNQAIWTWIFVHWYATGLWEKTWKGTLNFLANVGYMMWNSYRTLFDMAYRVAKGDRLEDYVVVCLPKSFAVTMEKVLREHTRSEVRWERR